MVCYLSESVARFSAIQNGHKQLRKKQTSNINHYSSLVPFQPLVPFQRPEISEHTPRDSRSTQPMPFPLNNTLMHIGCIRYNYILHGIYLQIAFVLFFPPNENVFRSFGLSLSLSLSPFVDSADRRAARSRVSVRSAGDHRALASQPTSS